MKPNSVDTLIYKSIKPLAEYIERINAEAIGMLRFAIRDVVDGYKRDLTRIKVSPDGTVKVSGKNADELAPTKKESAAIKKAVLKAKIPRSIPALNIDRLKKELGPEAGELFACHVKDGIAFVQERRDDKGSKYLPWTFFDDGEWRMLEPDDGLPIFGADQARGKVRRMYHEGAKAARAVHKLLADDKLEHPLKRWLVTTIILAGSEERNACSLPIGPGISAMFLRNTTLYSRPTTTKPVSKRW
jgi:hypothetical protein